MNGLRNFLPELLALSASSPFVENVNSGLHSARTQIFTRFFPRCGVPDAFASWQEYEDYVRFLYATGSVAEHTQIWWSVRPHLAIPTVEIRICDGQPDLADAQALAAFAASLAARIARAYDEGEPLVDQPHRLIEENIWRAIRYGLSGELIDLERGDVLPARARLERLLEWVGACRRGDRRRAVPRDPGAKRGRAPDRPVRGGRDARADLRRAGGGARPWLTSRSSPSSELLDALAQLKVSDLLVQTLSTISSLAYHRLSEEHRDLEQVRLAIEALRALLPVLSASLPPELLRDFEQVTANLQLAYAARRRSRPPESGTPGAL